MINHKRAHSSWANVQYTYIISFAALLQYRIWKWKVGMRDRNTKTTTKPVDNDVARSMGNHDRVASSTRHRHLQVTSSLSHWRCVTSTLSSSSTYLCQGQGATRDTWSAQHTNKLFYARVPVNSKHVTSKCICDQILTQFQILQIKCYIKSLPKFDIEF